MKNSYILHDKLRAAQGIKIAATGLEEAIAGSALMVSPRTQNQHISRLGVFCMSWYVELEFRVTQVVGEDDDLDEIKDEIIGDLDEILNKVDKQNRGVYVQASTLGEQRPAISDESCFLCRLWRVLPPQWSIVRFFSGSLEALLEFLRTSKIPVSGIAIGPVHKR